MERNINKQCGAASLRGGSPLVRRSPRIAANPQPSYRDQLGHHLTRAPPTLRKKSRAQSPIQNQMAPTRLYNAYHIERVHWSRPLDNSNQKGRAVQVVPSMFYRAFNTFSGASIGRTLCVVVALLAMIAVGGFLLCKGMKGEQGIDQMVGSSLETAEQDIQVVARSRADMKKDMPQHDISKMVIQSFLLAYKNKSQQEVNLKVNRSLKAYQQVIDNMVNQSVQTTEQLINQMVQKALQRSQETIDRMVTHSFQASKQELEQMVNKVLKTSQQGVNDRVHQTLQASHENLDNVIRKLINQTLQVHKDRSQQNVKQMIDQMMNESLTPKHMSHQDVQGMVKDFLSAYDADKIGKFDFLLENSGGSVIPKYCSQTYTHSIAQISFLGLKLWHSSTNPVSIIRPSVYPGDCWAMDGQSGYATIKMSSEAVITAVTLDHILQQMTPDGERNSAPKEFSVFGLRNLDDIGEFLGSFIYDLEGPSTQQYHIEKFRQNRPSAYVRFEFNSNHGHKEYTCVYRVRVHGHYP